MTLSSLFKKIIDEIILALPAIAFFLLSFQWIYYSIGLDLPPREIRYFTPLTVTIASLVLGKVLIIINTMPFINIFYKKPLICSILWKMFLYIIGIFLVWGLDASIKLYYKYRSFDVVFIKLQAELHSKILWASLGWIIYVFFIFVVFSEFTRAVSAQRIILLLFKKPQIKVEK